MNNTLGYKTFQTVVSHYFGLLGRTASTSPGRTKEYSFRAVLKHNDEVNRHEYPVATYCRNHKFAPNKRPLDVLPEGHVLWSDQSSWLQSLTWPRLTRPSDLHPNMDPVVKLSSWFRVSKLLLPPWVCQRLSTHWKEPKNPNSVHTAVGYFNERVA